MQRGASVFPPVQGRNLEGRVFHLPQDFEGEFNVVIVAFERWHQTLVDTWAEWLEALMADHATLRMYELPVISHRYRLMRPMIDGGMAAGITERVVRERTLTVYTDKTHFIHALGLDSHTITVLLLDRHGRVLWRGHGGYDEGQAGGLERRLELEEGNGGYDWA